MKLPYNPRYVGDKNQMWKAFLLGSLLVSSFVYFVTTENVFIFFIMLGLIIISAALFIVLNMSLGKVVYLTQNFAFFGLGALISLIINVIGYLSVYFVIIFVLFLVTYLHKYTVKIKPRKEKISEKKERE
ncbi:MAG: hypothetical protein QW051_04265 [Candidatus Aenigmatarchaeota archaeon]